MSPRRKPSVDGSLQGGARRFAPSIGIGIAVIQNDAAVAYGRGTPPIWIGDAAGADAWAFYEVVRKAEFPPFIITDCLGIVQTLHRRRRLPLAAS